MNPIEYLKSNGINPVNYSHGMPQRRDITRVSTMYYSPEATTCRNKRLSAHPRSRRFRSNVSQETLLGKFLQAKGWSSNNINLYAPFLTYLLADIVMLINEDYLKKIPFKQAEKRHCRAMMENYHKLIHEFFICFSRDDQDSVVELMDAFGEYIHNDLEIFRLAVQAPLMGFDEDFRVAISAICVCRLLCAHADMSYSSMYASTLVEDPSRRYLHAMEYNSRELFNAYRKRTQPSSCIDKIDLNSFPNIQNSMETVNRRILKFIKDYDAHKCECFKKASNL